MPETAPALLIEGLRHRFGEHVGGRRHRPAHRAGRDLRPARAERRGQDHDDPRAQHAAADRRRAASRSSATTSAGDPMAVRRRIGYVPQQLSIESALTGRENVTWFARLFDVPRGERTARVDDALDVMGLKEVADRPRRHLLGRHGAPARARAGSRQPAARCSCSTSRRWASTRWPATACGSGSRSCRRRRA